jgi:hypothetical protein
MGCRVYYDGRGMTGIVCSRGPGRRERCSTTGCRGESVALCDFPVEGHKAGKTCDRKMCAACRHPLSPNLDYCPTHDAIRKLQEGMSR